LQFSNEFLQRSHPARPDVLLGLVQEARQVNQMYKPFVPLRWEHDRRRFAGFGDDDGPIGSPDLFKEGARSFFQVFHRLDVFG
jgi:hypothetical protein